MKADLFERLLRYVGISLCSADRNTCSDIFIFLLPVALWLGVAAFGGYLISIRNWKSYYEERQQRLRESEMLELQNNEHATPVHAVMYKRILFADRMFFLFSEIRSAAFGWGGAALVIIGLASAYRSL